MTYKRLTRQKRKELEADYNELFGEQVIPMKFLFESKSDDILLDELNDNVSRALFQEIISDNIEKSEALLERMQLSVLEYDVLIFSDLEFDERDMNIYFHNDYQMVEFTNMKVKNHEDVKKIILMIMHIGNQYDQLYKSNSDVAKHLDEYRLLDGFDPSFIVDIKTGDAEKEAVN